MEITRLDAMIRQAVIDGNQRLERELSILRDSLLKAVPEKGRGRKGKGKVKEDKPSKTVKDNWRIYCDRANYHGRAPVMPRDNSPVEINRYNKEFSELKRHIGMFWRDHRKAGKHSYDILVYMGRMLLGEEVTFFSEKYSLNQLIGFEREELKKLGYKDDVLGEIFRIEK